MEEPDLRSLKKKWVEALRSGEYQQGEGSLFKNDAYCCLGVLCKIAGATFGGVHPVMREDDGELYPTTATATAYISPDVWAEEEELPPRMQDYFGLSSNAQSKLIEMNDGRMEGAAMVDRKRFSEIADWIEAHDLKTGKPISSSSDEVAAPPTSMEIEK